MGGIWFVHEFENHSWSQGVKTLQEEAEHYYGHQEGYSGEINSCSDIKLHNPPIDVLKSSKLLHTYIDNRQDKLSNGGGECIKLNLVGYSIAKPVISEVSYGVSFNPLTYLVKGSPASLIRSRGNYQLFIANGTLVQMRERAKRLILQEKFQYDYYIVTKSKVFFCTGEGTIVKKTAKQSNKDQLVLPIYKWLVYGWANS